MTENGIHIRQNGMLMKKQTYTKYLMYTYKSLPKCERSVLLYHFFFNEQIFTLIQFDRKMYSGLECFVHCRFPEFFILQKS